MAEARALCSIHGTASYSYASRRYVGAAAASGGTPTGRLWEVAAFGSISYEKGRLNMTSQVARSPVWGNSAVLQQPNCVNWQSLLTGKPEARGHVHHGRSVLCAEAWCYSCARRVAVLSSRCAPRPSRWHKQCVRPLQAPLPALMEANPRQVIVRMEGQLQQLEWGAERCVWCSSACSSRALWNQ